MSEVSQILNDINVGRLEAIDQLMPVVYEELRKLAVAKLTRERPDHTLQATALVHEAYMKLVGTGTEVTWEGRAHFFGAAAEAMRRILIDAARRRGREKHGGAINRLEFTDFQQPDEAFDWCKLDTALDALSGEDPEAGQVVKLKYFAGLGRESIAELLGLSVHQVRQKWDYARAWLRVALEETQ